MEGFRKANEKLKSSAQMFISFEPSVWIWTQGEQKKLI